VENEVYASAATFELRRRGGRGGLSTLTFSGALPYTEDEAKMDQRTPRLERRLGNGGAIGVDRVGRRRVLLPWHGSRAAWWVQRPPLSRQRNRRAVPNVPFQDLKNAPSSSGSLACQSRSCPDANLISASKQCPARCEPIKGPSVTRTLRPFFFSRLDLKTR
jgi:hypothetical protein